MFSHFCGAGNIGENQSHQMAPLVQAVRSHDTSRADNQISWHLQSRQLDLVAPLEQAVRSHDTTRADSSSHGTTSADNHISWHHQCSPTSWHHQCSQLDLMAPPVQSVRSHGTTSAVSQISWHHQCRQSNHMADSSSHGTTIADNHIS